MTPAPGGLDSHDLQQRLAAWRVTRRPEVLWPGVDEAAMRLAASRIVDVTRVALAAPSRPVPLQTAGPQEEAAFRAAAFMTGMGPLLGHWIHARVVAATPTLSRALATALEHAAARERRLLDELGLLAERFGDRGVPVGALKGAHTATRYFPTRGTRPMADLDVLVEPAHFMQSRALLTELGFTERQRGGLPDRSEWARRDVPLVHHSVEYHHELNPWMVDLHRSLNRRYVRIRRAGLGVPGRDDFTSHPTIPRVQALREPLLAAYLAVHAASGFPDVRLIHLVELCLVFRADFRSEEAWTSLVDRLREAGALGLAYPALALVNRLQPGTVPERVVAQSNAATTRRAVRLIPDCDLADLQYPWAYSITERLIWADTAWEAAAALLDTLVPPNASLQDLAYLFRRRMWQLAGRLGVMRSRR